MHEDILSRILGRTEALFLGDMHRNDSELSGRITQKRLLILGAAGSIGGAFVKQLVRFQPSAVHLVDLNENNLVEVVRDLRSSLVTLPDDFRTYAIGMGTPEFDAFLKRQDYDYIVNFAALKHVRSERDPYTLMRMLHTNVLAVDGVLRDLDGTGVKKFFSVSSDKAIAPASMMGATKSFMERVMLFHSEATPFSTARFANVAFSDGSLLYGFENRLQKKQPLSAPSDVRRYFITHAEAGQLCLLSCFLGDNRDIYFPKLDEKRDMRTFAEIACVVLESRGLTPRLCSSEEEAKELASTLDASSREWPCFFSESNTAGEKMYEEFYTDSDAVDFGQYDRVGIVKAPPMASSAMQKMAATLRVLEELRRAGNWSAGELVKRVQSIVPELERNDSNLDLDQKM